MTRRIRAVAGGTAASKTISILVWIIDYAQDKRVKDELISVVSESYPHLEKGAMRDFEMIMRDRGYWDESLWNKTKHEYTFETGNKLEFFSVDTQGKAHGPRRDILFLNECNNLSYEIVDQLIIRTRKVIWLDWNPTGEFWFYTEMQGRRNDVEFLKLTYLDNEALDEETKKEIELHKDNLYWWKVYGLGELGEKDGKVYSNWQIISDIPFEARLERYGLDFGYTNDPSALVALYFYNGGYILDEVLYRKGLSNEDIANQFKNLPPKLVIADSAEPKSIDEIARYGINILPTQKGKDSVMFGIQLVKNQKISVTSRSVNLLKEYRGYYWKTDRYGKIMNEPEKINDHLLDAARYALTSIIPIQKRIIPRRPPIFKETRVAVNPAL